MRLTNKDKEPLPHYGTKNIQFDLPKIIDKLGQLEDKEDKYGCELLILLNACEQGYIWTKEHNTKEQEIVCEKITLNLKNQTLDFINPRKEIGKGRRLLDYGKSWTLTREALV